MQNFDRVRGLLRSERDRIFEWMSRSLELNTRFMVPSEDARGSIGHDGSLNVGLDSLRRVVEGNMKTSSK
jgi:hypothetical protein